MPGCLAHLVNDDAGRLGLCESSGSLQGWSGPRSLASDRARVGIMDGDMDDARDGTRWMLYSELATARGISRASATRLAFRKHWPRRTGNDGQARVAVPPDGQVPSPDATPDATLDASRVAIPDNHGGAALARERERVDAAEARADRAESRADRAEVREAEFRTITERQGQELTAALLRTAIAETETRALREALDEARRPVWRRWLGLP